MDILLHGINRYRVYLDAWLVLALVRAADLESLEDSSDVEVMNDLLASFTV